MCSDILAMLEGGNKQLGDFFARHQLSSSSSSSSISQIRYRTNAAKFYKDNLQRHILRVIDVGVYKGRNSNRKLVQKKTEKNFIPHRRKNDTSCSNSNNCEMTLRSLHNSKKETSGAIIPQ